MFKNTYDRLSTKIRFNLNQPKGNPDIPYSIAYAQKCPQNKRAMFNLIYPPKDDKLASRRPGNILWLMAKKENESVTTVSRGRNQAAWIRPGYTKEFRFTGKTHNTNFNAKARVA